MVRILISRSAERELARLPREVQERLRMLSSSWSRIRKAPAWPRHEAPSRNEGCLATADRVVPRDIREEAGKAAAPHAVRAPEGRLPFLSRLPSVKAFRSASARGSPTPSRSRYSSSHSGIRGGTSRRTTSGRAAAVPESSIHIDGNYLRQMARNKP